MATQVPRFCTSAIEIVIGTEIAIGMAAAIEATPIGINHIIDPTVTISPMAILTISPTAIMGILTITAGQASASSSDSKWGHTGFMDGISAIWGKKALVAGSGNGETMRLLILLLALIIGAAYIQSVRNHCHLGDVRQWAECVIKPSW